MLLEKLAWPQNDTNTIVDCTVAPVEGHDGTQSMGKNLIH